MSQSYTEEFKNKIVRLHLDEGRTCRSITEEYGVSKASISKWCREFSKECQNSEIGLNDYYNYLKKKEKRRRKKQVLQAIEEIYHEHEGVDGYRRIKVYLERRGIYLSNLTVFKYMKELKLKSITRRKKMPYKKGSSHKVFENILNRISLRLTPHAT